MSEVERLLASIKSLLGEAQEDAKDLTEAVKEREFKAIMERGSAALTAERLAERLRNEVLAAELSARALGKYIGEHKDV